MQIPYLPCLISIVFVLERQVGFEGMNQAQLMRKHSQLEPKLTLQPAQSTPTPFPWITGISPVYEHGGGGYGRCGSTGGTASTAADPPLASHLPLAESCRDSLLPWLTRAPILYHNYSTSHLIAHIVGLPSNKACRAGGPFFQTHENHVL